MTPLVIVLVIALAAILLFIVKRTSRTTAGLDLGAVSTRWLSELRRDEPWTRS